MVVHGHDKQLRAEVARVVERLGLKAIILDEQPDAGLTLIEKFERHAGKANAAIVLLRPDDLGGPRNTAKFSDRARQNVLFELGYFVKGLGRGKVCLMRRGAVEIPSDLHGIMYVPVDDNNGWILPLANNRKAAGLNVDLNKLHS